MFNILNTEEKNLLKEKLTLVKVCKNLINNNLFNNKIFNIDKNFKDKAIDIDLNSFYGLNDSIDCIEECIFNLLKSFLSSNLKYFNIIAGGQQEVENEDSDELYENVVYGLDEINSDLKEYNIEPLVLEVYTEFVYIGYYFIIKNDLLKQYMDKYNDLKTLENILGNNMYSVKGYYFYDPYTDSIDINIGYKNDGSILILVSMDISIVTIIDAILKMFKFIYEKLNFKRGEK